MSAAVANFERYEHVLHKEPGQRTLAECSVLDEWMGSVALLQALDGRSRMELCQNATARAHAAGRAVARQGKQAERLLILFSGQLALVAQGPGSAAKKRTVGNVGPGGTLGEIELLTGEPFAASAIAVSAAVVVSIDAMAFDATLRPTYGKELLQRAQFLQTTSPFRSWGVAALVDLARFSQARSTIRGKEISNAGQQRREQLVFFVVSGTVRAHGFREAGEPGEGEGDAESPMILTAGAFWGLSCLFPELNEGSTLTAHSSNVELLTIEGNTLAGKVDEQTLQHFGVVAGFAAARNEQRRGRPASASSTATGDAVEITAPPATPPSADPADLSGSELVSQVIERASLPRPGLGLTHSGWLPLRVEEAPRPSRVWAAEDAASGIAHHMEELTSLLDTNELLLAQLGGDSCVSILSALCAVNRILDEAGVWRGHSSAKEARQQLEDEAELKALTGQSMDARMGRLQLEVLLKLTIARIGLMVENTEAGLRVEIVADKIEEVHQQIDQCLEVAHAELLESNLGGKAVGAEMTIAGSSRGDEPEEEPEEDRLDAVLAAEGAPAETQRVSGEHSWVHIGGHKYLFGSGLWAWRSRTAYFQYSFEENRLIEKAWTAWKDGGPRTTEISTSHFVDFELMRQIRSDSHDHWREIKRVKAGLERHEIPP